MSIGIPRPQKPEQSRISPKNLGASLKEHKKVLFSFEAIDKNEYFNLDGTCQNWSSDLFDTMQKVSYIEIKDIMSGRYSGKQSPLRIHAHQNAKAPCKVPDHVSLEDMWQIRISLSKGGIHGVFFENIFYVIWFDPQHNLYPDNNHGGLKKIKPPSTCCKDRDSKIAELKEEFEKSQQECKRLKQENEDLWKELCEK